MENQEDDKSGSKKKIIHILINCIVVFLLLILIVIIINYVHNKTKYDIKKKVFKLSDNSILTFHEDNNYELNYKVMNQDVNMQGKYKITFDEEISDNILYEYKYYIDKLKKDNSKLGFLELQNKELYINNIKSEDKYINTYYILIAYYEDENLKFVGYNVDTGIKVEFDQQIGEYNK